MGAVVSKLTDEGRARMREALSRNRDREPRGFLSEDGPRRAEQEPVTLEGMYCSRETEKALLVGVVGSTAREQWIPKSQVHDDSEVYAPSHEGKLVIARWLAVEKGWVDE
jgi:hypothetical protein